MEFSAWYAWAPPNLIVTIQSMLENKPAPYMMIIHCGGNDLGQINLGSAQYILKSAIQEISILLPYTRIVFSQILPRLKYRDEINHIKLIKGSRRLNTALSKLCISLGGC